MALPNAYLNGKELIDYVSVFAGLQNDTPSRAWVLKMFNLALQHVALHTPWSWLELTGSNITVTSGTATYNLPTGTGAVFDEVYDVRLVGNNERTLDPISRRTLDRAARGDQDAGGVPSHYHLYAAFNSGHITLYPTPNVGDTLRLRYYRRESQISDATGSELALPDKYLLLPIFKATEFLCAWKRPDMVGYWKTNYDEAIRRAKSVNQAHPDEVPAFSPGIEHSADRVDPIDPDDLSFYPR